MKQMIRMMMIVRVVMIDAMGWIDTDPRTGHHHATFFGDFQQQSVVAVLIGIIFRLQRGQDGTFEQIGMTSTASSMIIIVVVAAAVGMSVVGR